MALSNGTLKVAKTNVDIHVNSIYSTGKLIATITVNGTEYKIYQPEEGGGDLPVGTTYVYPYTDSTGSTIYSDTKNLVYGYWKVSMCGAGGNCAQPYGGAYSGGGGGSFKGIVKISNTSGILTNIVCGNGGTHKSPGTTTTTLLGLVCSRGTNGKSGTAKASGGSFSSNEIISGASIYSTEDTYTGTGGEGSGSTPGYSKLFPENETHDYYYGKGGLARTTGTAQPGNDGYIKLEYMGKSL